LWGEIEALDNKVEASVQIDMLHEINNLLERGTTWFMNNGTDGLNISNHVKQFGGGVTELAAKIDGVLPEHYRKTLMKRSQPYRDAGVPEELAARICGLVNLYAGCGLVRLAGAHKMSVVQASQIYFHIGARFKFGRLRHITEGLGAGGYWQQLAADALIDESFTQQLNVVAQVIDMKGIKAPALKSIDSWIAKNQVVVDRVETMLGELWTSDSHDVSMIAVASRQLKTLCQDD
jgi:glutamate dehydrogenase